MKLRWPRTPDGLHAKISIIKQRLMLSLFYPDFEISIQRKAARDLKRSHTVNSLRCSSNVTSGAPVGELRHD
jgi:hypothetical protein